MFVKYLTKRNHTIMPPSKFHRRHCLLFTTETIFLSETISYISDHLGSLTARGDNSKILILAGSHGHEDGTDGMTDKLDHDEKAFKDTCLWLGTNHHKMQAANCFQEIRPWSDVKVDAWKGGPLYSHRPELIDEARSLTQQLSDIGARVEVLNIGEFHGRPEALVAYVRAGQPTAIIINWCNSKDGYTARLLTRAGLCSQLVLANERVLITGNKEITLDKHQEDFLARATSKISDRQKKPTEHGLAFLIYGPSGEERMAWNPIT